MSEAELLEIFPEGKAILINKAKRHISACNYWLNYNDRESSRIRSELNDTSYGDMWIKEWYLELTADENQQLLKDIKQSQWKIKFLQGKVSPGKDQITDADIYNAKQIKIETLYTDRLRRQGNKLWGKCRFHEERSASFVIYADQNSFHCYGCNANGSAIDFVMQSQNLSFLAAVKLLLHK